MGVSGSPDGPVHRISGNSAPSRAFREYRDYEALARIPFINGGKLPVGILSRVDCGESRMPRTATNRNNVATRDIDTDTQKGVCPALNAPEQALALRIGGVAMNANLEGLSSRSFPSGGSSRCAR